MKWNTAIDSVCARACVCNHQYCFSGLVISKADTLHAPSFYFEFISSRFSIFSAAFLHPTHPSLIDWRLLKASTHLLLHSAAMSSQEPRLAYYLTRWKAIHVCAFHPSNDRHCFIVLFLFCRWVLMFSYAPPPPPPKLPPICRCLPCCKHSAISIIPGHRISSAFCFCLFLQWSVLFKSCWLQKWGEGVFKTTSRGQGEKEENTPWHFVTSFRKSIWLIGLWPAGQQTGQPPYISPPCRIACACSAGEWTPPLNYWLLPGWPPAEANFSCRFSSSSF